MGIVFAVLILLALSIKVLSMFDRDPGGDAESAGASPVSAGTSASTPGATGEVTGQQVAAIALALALSEPVSSPVPESPGPPSFGPSTGSWLQSGRMRALGAALNPGRRRER